MSELEQYISSYFGVVDKNDLQKIGFLFKKTEIKKGEFYLKTSKTCKTLSFIQEGMLRIFVNTPDKEITQWISTPGYFITDLSSFINETPARWNIQALTDTIIYTISKEDYKSISTLVPIWNELEKMFLIKCFTYLEDRIFSHLSMSAEERYQFFYDQNKELFNQVPLQYIASLLGMTPETISRIRKKQLD